MSTRITFLISDGTKVGLDKQNKNRSVASGLNLYAYCLNDPVNNSDPEGTWSWEKFFIGVASTCAVAAMPTKDEHYNRNMFVGWELYNIAADLLVISIVSEASNNHRLSMPLISLFDRARSVDMEKFFTELVK